MRYACAFVNQRLNTFKSWFDKFCLHEYKDIILLPVWSHFASRFSQWTIPCLRDLHKALGIRHKAFVRRTFIFMRSKLDAGEGILILNLKNETTLKPNFVWLYLVTPWRFKKTKPNCTKWSTNNTRLEYKYLAILYGYLNSWLFCNVRNLFNQSNARATLLYPLCFSRLMRNDRNTVEEK